MTVHDLPLINALLNGVSAFFLALGFAFIKLGKKTAHRHCMVAAFGASVVFLTSYLTYHVWLGVLLHQGPTRFLKPEWFRPFYLAILFSHTLLAAVIVPLILATLWRAKKERFDAHKKVAQWTWPLWMYVSVTGVVIYWLLYVKYPQH